VQVIPVADYTVLSTVDALAFGFSQFEVFTVVPYEKLN